MILQKTKILLKPTRSALISFCICQYLHIPVFFNLCLPVLFSFRLSPSSTSFFSFFLLLFNLMHL